MSHLSPLRPKVAYLQRETFSFMMSHPAMSLGDRFCDSRKGGTGGGGWVHPECANSMAVSGLRGRKVLVGTGKAISAVFGINKHAIKHPEKCQPAVAKKRTMNAGKGGPTRQLRQLLSKSMVGEL